MALAKAVVGAPATPTPTGRFAIAELARQPDPDGFLGPFALHLTAQNMLEGTTAAGRDGSRSTAAGGESLSDPLGSARSHGCIRVDNAEVRFPRATPRRGGAGGRGLLDSTAEWGSRIARAMTPGESEERIFAPLAGLRAVSPGAGGNSAENYSIAIPPPNVTGALHMGHALNGSIQDTLIRYHRMRGKRTKWLRAPTTPASRRRRRSSALLEPRARREEIGREAFVERVWRWREEYGGKIIEQYKRLGASCDYEDERFTMDENYVARC